MKNKNLGRFYLPALLNTAFKSDYDWNKVEWVKVEMVDNNYKAVFKCLTPICPSSIIDDCRTEEFEDEEGFYFKFPIPKKFYNDVDNILIGKYSNLSHEARLVYRLKKGNPQLYTVYDLETLPEDIDNKIVPVISLTEGNNKYYSSLFFALANGKEYRFFDAFKKAIASMLDVEIGLISELCSCPILKEELY